MQTLGFQDMVNIASRTWEGGVAGGINGYELSEETDGITAWYVYEPNRGGRHMIATNYDNHLSAGSALSKEELIEAFIAGKRDER